MVKDGAQLAKIRLVQFAGLTLGHPDLGELQARLVAVPRRQPLPDRLQIRKKRLLGLTQAMVPSWPMAEEHLGCQRIGGPCSHLPVRVGREDGLDGPGGGGSTWREKPPHKWVMLVGDDSWAVKKPAPASPGRARQRHAHLVVINREGNGSFAEVFLWI